MELIIVKTDDVYPDENNPREDFSGTEELAESFWLNPERPGEPFQPPLLVRDGGIYHIYDGERRFRAIQHNKLESFTANVCENFEEADRLAAMLATNDKKPLTELEASRGVQRMMRLGVDPVKVEKAARMPKGSATKVAKAMELVDDAGEDLTLDRMLAVAEFSDDREAVDKIMNCKENKWQLVAQQLREIRNRKEVFQAIKERAAELGAVLVPDEEMKAEPGYRFDYQVYRIYKLEDFERAVEERPDDRYGYTENYSIYPYCPTKPAEAKMSAEDIELEKKTAQLMTASEAAFSELRVWFQSICVRGAYSIPNFRDYVIDYWKELVKYDEASEVFPELCNSTALAKADLAVGFLKAVPWTGFSHDMARHILRGSENYYTGRVPDIADVFALAEKDGFKFCEASLPLKEAIDAYMEMQVEEDDEDGDE